MRRALCGVGVAFALLSFVAVVAMFVMGYVAIFRHEADWGNASFLTLLLAFASAVGALVAGMASPWGDGQ